MLKRKASDAIIWSTLDQFVQQGLFFATSLILARLVTPEEYGTVALLQLFTAIATVFIDGGLSSALIQKKQSTQADESTVFWFNIAVGTLMSLVLFIFAPLVASFYSIPVLVPLTRVISLQLFLGACNSVQGTLFSKKLDFRIILKIGLLTNLASSCVGIVMAWKGFGVWALVGQTTTFSVAQTLITWRFSKWRPTWQFQTASFKSLFNFGGFLFLAGLLDAIYSRFYTLVIGRLYGALELGIYNRAEGTKQLPVGMLTVILSRVAFPIFSQTSQDIPKLLNGFRLSIRTVMFVTLPVMLGIVVVAKPLILTLFGRAWGEAVPLLRILALGGILWPLHVLNLSILKALGESKKFIKVEMAKKCVGLLLLLAGTRFGLVGMAYATVISSVFSFIFNAYYSGQLLGYGAWRQVVDFSPSLFCSLIMSSVVGYFATLINRPPIIELTLLTIVGIGIYLIFVKSLLVREFNEILSLLNARTRAVG